MNDKTTTNTEVVMVLHFHIVDGFNTDSFNCFYLYEAEAIAGLLCLNMI